MISFAQKKTGSIAIMRFDKGTAAVLRPLPAFGLLFPHLCSSSPCLDDSELFCFHSHPTGIPQKPSKIGRF
jgi:hypothetical protein